MTFWPEDYTKAWTLAGESVRSGVGLHSGATGTVRLRGSESPGIHLRFQGSNQSIRLAPEQVRDSQLCTTLNLGDHQVATVEHLLAALAGCGLSHVEIELDGHEVPLLDGSALGWVEAIDEAGVAAAPTQRPDAPVLDGPLVFHRGSSVITATPADRFRVVGMIDFPQAAIGQQQLTLDMTPQTFVDQIAPARTFGFQDQVEQLRAAGLIQGGALDNALVCDGDNWLNPPLRFDDEPVRHKLLDLIGDLALVGFPQAQVLVYRGSHGLHTDLAAAL